VKKQYQGFYIGLGAADRVRLSQLAQEKKTTRTEIARDAIHWYLAHHEQFAGRTQESELAQSVRYLTDQLVKASNGGTDRICKMLARQGRAIATLYELSWMSLPDDETARKAFHVAAQKAKQRIAKHVENDERELAERMRNVVNSERESSSTISFRQEIDQVLPAADRSSGQSNEPSPT
jgi:hypothetical protein